MFVFHLYKIVFLCLKVFRQSCTCTCTASSAVPCSVCILYMSLCHLLSVNALHIQRLLRVTAYYGFATQHAKDLRALWRSTWSNYIKYWILGNLRFPVRSDSTSRTKLDVKITGENNVTSESVINCSQWCFEVQKNTFLLSSYTNKQIQ